MHKGITRSPRDCRSVCVIAGLSLLAIATHTSAQITFNQDFDAGSLKVSATTVDYSDPNSPLVTLAIRDTRRRVHPRTHFQALGVLGLTPEFRVSAGGQPDAHRHAYSYDYENWYFFDNGDIGSTWATFSHNTPFTQDSVYIAHVLPYPMYKTDQFVASIKSNPYVSPTLSADANLVVGRTLGTPGGGYFDDYGRFVPAQNLYGFQITDTSATGPKSKIVISGGTHPAENTGNYAVEGLIRFLISTDPRAERLRQHAEFYFYPQTNPEGKYNGYHRTNPEYPNVDHNAWVNWGDVMTDLAIIQAAMKADTGSDVDYFIDFHSFGSATQIGQLWTSSEFWNADFGVAARTYEPEITHNEYMDPVSALGWARSAEGLNADYAYIPEIGVVVDKLEPDYLDQGRRYGLTLSEIVGPARITGDASGDDYVDDDDLSLLLANWYTYTGLVNGDWSGNGYISDADLNLLLANWNSGTPPTGSATVPEPSFALVLMLGFAGLIRQRRKR